MSNILVVDDSAIMRKNLKTILTQAGHTVVAEAANGGQAHQLYNTYLPDLVTMDITMPGLNGIEALKLIIKDYPEAKIVMVSALSQKNMVFEAIELGAKHYLIKPITPETVVSVVNKVLNAKQPSPGKSSQDTVPPNDVKSEKIESPDPFKIENRNNMFLIKISNKLTEESFVALNQAIQGLLFVQPLIVIINFGNTDSLSDFLLEKLSEIVKAIQGAKGTLKIVAQNKEFIKIVRTKKLAGLSELLEVGLI